MSDLISRSALIKVLKDRATNEAIMGYMTAYDVTNSIIDEVEEQPTAYSVDKVVEELKCDRCESCSLLEVCAGSKYCGKCHEKIIEIVKQGGVSDDVCEWIKYDYRTICPKNHDANNPYWRIPDNTDKLKYCPYCGKKIKVVD